MSTEQQSLWQEQLKLLAQERDAIDAKLQEAVEQ